MKGADLTVLPLQTFIDLLNRFFCFWQLKSRLFISGTLKNPAKKKKMCFLVMFQNCGVSKVALGHCTVQSVCEGVCVWL